MPPLESNARVLREAGVRRFALLIRDPRQAAVSLAYHNLLASSTPQNVRPNTPQAYDRVMLAATMDQALDFVSSFAANWLNGWKIFAAKTDIDAVFLKHEDLAVDSDRFFHNVLEFFDAPEYLHDKVRDVLREAESSRDSGGLNWRLGQTDEWKTILSHNQIDRLRAGLGGAFDHLYDI
jgi:Sulfotransferase domain